MLDIARETRVRTRTFSIFRIDSIPLIPRNYVKVGPGYNVDYEAPLLLGCLPATRHLQHQHALLNFMKKIYSESKIPEEAINAYLTNWIEFYRRRQKSRSVSLMHYGLTFQNRNHFGDYEPMPFIRFVFP